MKFFGRARRSLLVPADSDATAADLVAPQLIALRYVWRPARMRPGHAIRVMRAADEFFDELLQRIESARVYIHAEIYQFSSDSIGMRVAAALGRAAQRGVIVRLIYDVVGTGELHPEAADYMVREGVYVRPFRLGRTRRHWRGGGAGWRARWSPSWNRRNHRKYFVFDGEAVLCGGANVADPYVRKSKLRRWMSGFAAASTPQPPPSPEVVESYAERAADGSWLDFVVCAQGPVVVEFDRLFARTWAGRSMAGDGNQAHLARPLVRRRGPLRLRRRRPAVRSQDGDGRVGGVRVAMLATGDGLRRDEIALAYIHAIRSATRSVRIWNAYFLPTGGLRRALVDAAKRGVEVEVIVPKASDVRLVEWAMRRQLGRWLRHGVRVYAFRGRMMHAKVCVVDGVWATVGSANLDPRSRFHNAEVNIGWVDEVTAAQLEGAFAEDRAYSDALSWPEWKRRPWHQRALEWIASLFHYWL